MLPLYAGTTVKRGGSVAERMAGKSPAVTLAFEQQLGAYVEIRAPRLQDFLRSVKSFAEQVAHGDVDLRVVVSAA